MKVSEPIQYGIKLLQDKFEEDKKDLIIEHAKSVNPYKVGDILKDHYHIGRVISVSYQYSLQYYTFDIVYKCDRLKKDLTNYLSCEKIDIYYSNVNHQLG